MHYSKTQTFYATVSEMTYIVWSGTLNPSITIPYHAFYALKTCAVTIRRLHVTCPNGRFVTNGVVQIPKFDANPNPNSNLTLT